jgi:2-polyprenyl-6-methoxyphenol hydroxylase-like FAD-dependent oxidoreductase
MHTDVLIVGGGPAGLSAAIAARTNGLRVTLVDARRPPLDKPCGEGLLPEAVSTLRFLGIDFDSGRSHRFAGIRFSDSASSVDARFANASAFGVRRTVLHNLLRERAAELGVLLMWGVRLTQRDPFCAEVEGRRIFFRWLVAADGIHSAIRRRAGLDLPWRSKGRFAFRRHYAVAPWSDLVEVYWGDNCQLIVTPTAPEEVCIALFTRDHRLRIASALTQFPALARRIEGARAVSTEAGACTVLARARAVARGNVALIGDAARSIDGIAGQGLSLAFQSARHLGPALAQGDLRSYAAAHAEITSTPANITRLLLLMAGSPWVRRKTLRMFAAKPAFFSKMMSVHAGTSRENPFGLHDLAGLGWRVLRA